MNILIKSLLIFLFSFLFMDAAHSQFRQGTNFVTLEYSTAYNIGSANDFISKPGWGGLAFSYKSFVKNNVALGISAGWNIFGRSDANGTSNFTYENYIITVTGPQARYINYIPIYANASYFICSNQNSKVVPYLQANIGTLYSQQRLQLGANTLNNNNWHFAVAPEAGLIFNLDGYTGITFNGKYNYAFSSGTAVDGSSSNAFSFFNVNLGITYRR